MGAPRAGGPSRTPLIKIFQDRPNTRYRYRYKYRYRHRGLGLGKDRHRGLG